MAYIFYCICSMSLLVAMSLMPVAFLLLGTCAGAASLFCCGIFLLLYLFAALTEDVYLFKLSFVLGLDSIDEIPEVILKVFMGEAVSLPVGIVYWFC